MFILEVCTGNHPEGFRLEVSLLTASSQLFPFTRDPGQFSNHLHISNISFLPTFWTSTCMAPLQVTAGTQSVS
jgi:hypothetical protein